MYRLVVICMSRQLGSSQDLGMDCFCNGFRRFRIIIPNMDEQLDTSLSYMLCTSSKQDIKDYSGLIRGSVGA